MGSYIDDVLGKDEEIIYRASVSLLYYWHYFLIGIILLISHLLVLSVFFFLWPFIVRSSTDLVITNRRIVAKIGIISRETVEINFKKIESIKVQQGIIGRLLNCGNITVTGSGSTKAPIQHISNPLEFRRAYDDAIVQLEDGVI